MQCFVVHALALDLVRWEGEASGQKGGVSLNSYLMCALEVEDDVSVIVVRKRLWEAQNYQAENWRSMGGSRSCQK